nr:uncharacterized protein LOC114924424 [Arachis hypogaea]
MELVDLPLTDRMFTWFRGHSCSRIDRAMVSLEWLEQFPETRMRGGPRGLSNHCPIIVEDKKLRGGPRPFRSLDSWFTHEGFLKMVKEEWRGLGVIQFTDKLKALTVPVGRWHKANFSDIDKKITTFEEKIKKIDDMVSNGVYDETIEARRKALVTCCERWYVRKEIHWKQMSRSRQAKEMDKNTRYFHNIASTRRGNNMIDTLLINGRLVRNHARIKIAIRDFYTDLYHQEDSPMVGFRNGLVGSIGQDDAVKLEMLPSAEEIREAVWDCKSSKAPSYDGLPAESNITWVALAPKFVGAREIKDLQPISMVGSVYKIISKRKEEATIIKLDFQKAYDRVKWSFVDLVLQKMGFGIRWRSWVMECVTIASMSVLINSSPSKPFKIERGLRQGDPLSPFLFVLVVDVLHRMIAEAVRNGRISPLLVGRDSVELSHLQFADDIILFSPPEEKTIKNYKRLLRCFELMSGLSINFDKSSLITVNCDEQWVQCMCHFLGCKGGSLPVKYLGIPLGPNPRLVKTWKPIIDKVEEKLSLWKAKLQNKVGKLVLIKSVLNSLPMYYLSLFKMPKAVAVKLISLQRGFLWRKDDGSNGMALVKWEVVQAPKKLGGLGVGDAMVGVDLKFPMEKRALSMGVGTSESITRGLECLDIDVWPIVVISRFDERIFLMLDRGTKEKGGARATIEMFLCDRLEHLVGKK